MRISAENNLNLSVAVRGDETQSYQGIHALKSMAVHQTIAGEIVDIRDGYAKVSIGEDAFFWANTGNMDVAKGQTLVLELMRSTGNQISLRPLYQNLSHDQNLMRALEAADLPKTPRNLEMVAYRMESGLPIDKNSLLDVSKELMRFPDADVRDIHLLTSMKMDVNDVNLSLIENLRSSESMILSRTDAVSEDIVKTFLAINEMPEGSLPEEVRAVLDGVAEAKEAGEAVSVEKQPKNTEQSVASEAPVAGSETAMPKAEEIKGSALTELPPKAGSEGAESVEKTDSGTGLNQNAVPKEGLQAGSTGDMVQTAVNAPISRDAETFLRSQLNAAGLSDTQIEEILTKVKSAKPEHMPAALKAEVRDALENAWSFDASTLKEKDSIARYYDKVYEQASAIERNFMTVSSLALKDAGMNLSGAAGEISDSLAFLHQMNQAMSFVEIPLKMMGGESGELYVMAKKHSVGEESDEQTAYIRLNMDHLGMVECGIRINSEKLVQTNFVLQDEETLRFVEEYLPMLDESLTARGYHTSIHMRKKEDSEDVDILGSIASCLNESPKRISVAETYGFDVLA